MNRIRNHVLMVGAMLMLILSGIRSAAPARAGDQQCFPPTNLCIEGRFLQFWQDNGGLSIFGYPITAARDETNRDTGKTYLTQWFERNRFELHPENAAPYDVLLGRLGDDQLRSVGIDWQQLPGDTARQPGCLWFARTQLNVCNQSDEAGAQAGFMNYWLTEQLRDPRLDSYGRSLALFGLPLTRPRMEVNSSGDNVLTQWFERARFEWHPNNPPGFRVQLGLVGTELRRPAGQPAGGVQYVSAGALYELRPDGTSRRLQSIANLGTVLDAVQWHGDVILLCERGLQSVSAAGVTTIATFSRGNARFGSLVDPAGSDLVLYSYARDVDSPMGFEGVVGMIRNASSATKLFDAPNVVKVLGISTDSNAVYVVDQGQDPSFVQVRVVQIPTGETINRLSFQGMGAVAESPDRLKLVAVDQPGDHPDVLKVYDLATANGAQRSFKLPRPGWNAWQVIWARDSRQVFVVMAPSQDNPKGELYRVDVASGHGELVATNIGIDTRLLSISPDGRQVLVSEQAGAQAWVGRLDLATGTLNRAGVPVDAVIARWH